MASFNSNRNQPSVPVVRQLRHVVEDIKEGLINTNTRYGRKHQWKIDQSALYIKCLLDGDMHVDPISLSEQGAGSAKRENAVNGNNRLRTIVMYRSNKFGVDAQDFDGKVYTWYYNSIPQSELDRPSRRAKCKILTDVVRRNFDDFPLLLNIRHGLSETQEIEWYKMLNRNMKAHSPGHLLVANICDPMSAFASAMLATFPAMKVRVHEPPAESDADSLGVAISEATGVEFDPMHQDDKRESVLLAHATVFNLLVNGLAYNEEFKGIIVPRKLADHATAMKSIFTNATFSQSLKNEMDAPVNTKPYLKTLCQPGYLLGPIAWSISTEKPMAVELWTRFLNSCVSGTIEDVYGRHIADAHIGDPRLEKYSMAWNRMVAYLDANAQ